MDDNELAHVGVLGMRWGRRNEGPNGEKMTTVRGKLVPKVKLVRGKPVQVYNNSPIREAFKKNPTARNVAIGVGVGLTVAVAGAVYLKNKKQVDSTVKSFLQKSGSAKVKDLPRKAARQFSDEQVQVFKKYGLKTQDFVKARDVNAGRVQILSPRNMQPMDIGARTVYRLRK